MRDWLDSLEHRAPDVVSSYRALDDTPAGLMRLRRELRRRGGEGTAARVAGQHEAIADALRESLEAMPDEALRLPGGEEDWNVAQAFAHTTRARRGLAWYAELAASGRWPADAPTVVPGVPGPADATRDTLLLLLDKSRRAMATSAERIAGHERDECPIDHPLVGRLRCGEWLLFAGVHDLMHLEQLDALASRAAGV